jgi:hypothetical protein
LLGVSGNILLRVHRHSRLLMALHLYTGYHLIH